jgi:hypothetical protein
MSNLSGIQFDGDGQDEETERDLLRQHAENLVRMSYQSLRDVMDGVGQHREGFDTDQADEVLPEPDGTQPTHLELWKETSEKETTQWLYELVFSSYVESRSGLPPTSKSPEYKADTEQLVETGGAINEERALLVTIPRKICS